MVTDRKLGQDTTVNATYTPQYYLPDIYSVQNYYAFGQNLPKWSSSALNDPKRYRFGFNGKEDDDEWTKQDYGFRMYDPRVARFLTVDPLAAEYPWYTPYQFAGDMPIKFVDLDGLEPASPDQYGTSSEGLPILKSSAIDHGDPSHPDNRREVKPQEFTPPPPIAEIKSTPNDRKTDAFSKHNSNVLKTWVADPQALKEGDPLEWASIIPIGKGIKGAKALGKAIKGADELVDAVKGVEKVAEAAAKTSTSFFNGTKYTDKVLGQIKKGDFHAFPESVKAFESNGVISTIKGGDEVTRQMLKIPGEYGGKKGFFEFIKDADGSINHRLFKPNQ